MSSYKKALFDRILRGKNGGNKGLPTGMDVLDRYTYGVQRGFTYLITGDSGFYIF